MMNMVDRMIKYYHKIKSLAYILLCHIKTSLSWERDNGRILLTSSNTNWYPRVIIWYPLGIGENIINIANSAATLWIVRISRKFFNQNHIVPLATPSLCWKLIPLPNQNITILDPGASLTAKLLPSRALYVVPGANYFKDWLPLIFQKQECADPHNLLIFVSPRSATYSLYWIVIVFTFFVLPRR